MKNTFTLLLFLSAVSFSFGQTNSFFNQTEFGPMFGRVQSWDDNFDTRINFSIQTFNGVRVDPDHAVGLLIGLDSYPSLRIMPIAFGWRGFMNSSKRHVPYAGLDIGYGSAWLEKRITTQWGETWYEGGLLIHPSIGIKRKAKHGNHHFTWSIGYKRQHAFFYEANQIVPNPIQFENSNMLPPGYQSIREEAYAFNNLTFKWGIIF